MKTRIDDPHTPEQAPLLSRRQSLSLLGAGAAALAAPAVLAQSFAAGGRDSRTVYVGTYTAPGVPPGGVRPSTAAGIYVFRANRGDGDLALVQVVAASNPSYLAQHPTLPRLYSVNEDEAGRVSAYAIEADGRLRFINSASTNGAYPTHLSVHPSGRYLMAANYGTGSVPVFALTGDGAIGVVTSTFQGASNGTGPNPDRQEGPHAHQVLTDLDGLHVFDVDLGADKVNVLNLNLSSGILFPNTVPFANASSGSGPRHMAFHSDRKHAYVLNELASTVSVFNYDPARGALVWIQTISTLPKGFSGANTTAEIRITPNGRFLYNTNRGHNSVAEFEIQADGTLESLGWHSSGGEWPRGMNIDPSGSFLYVANQNTDNILVLGIGRNGRLQRTGAVVRTPVPVDILFGRN